MKSSKCYICTLVRVVIYVAHCDKAHQHDSYTLTPARTKDNFAYATLYSGCWTACNYQERRHYEICKLMLVNQCNKLCNLRIGLHISKERTTGEYGSTPIHHKILPIHTMYTFFPTMTLCFLLPVQETMGGVQKLTTSFMVDLTLHSLALEPFSLVCMASN